MNVSVAGPRCESRNQQQPQQTGMLFIIMQQVQPDFRHAEMHSQQPWIMSLHLVSPEVQVTVQPFLVISTLHMPTVRLQVQITMPFIMQHMLHMPPASIWHRFCIMAQAAGSSQVQAIFMPPCIFSTLNVQRGTITMFGAMPPAAVPIGMPPIVGLAMPIAGRSIIIALFIFRTPSVNIPGLTAAPSQGRLDARLVVRTWKIQAGGDCPVVFLNQQGRIPSGIYTKLLIMVMMTPRTSQTRL